MKVSGTIRRNDLEGGHWVLETDAGERYQLSGEVAALQDGLKAEVTGDVERNMMGIGMTGPMFKVKKVEPKT
jgi:hypothetical protein